MNLGFSHVIAKWIVILTLIITAARRVLICAVKLSNDNTERQSINIETDVYPCRPLCLECPDG